MVVVAIVSAVIAAHPSPLQVFLLDDTGHDVPEKATGFESATDRWFGRDPHVIEKTRYLEAPARSGETAEQAARRLLPALPQPPPGHRFLLARRVGTWSVYEAFSRQMLATVDVESAALEQSETPAPDDVSVRLRLTPSAAEKFAAASGAAVGHRIAIVVDGAIEREPVVRTRITWGAISVVFAKGVDRVSRGRKLIFELARAAGRDVPAEALQLPMERPWTRVVAPGVFEILLPLEPLHPSRHGQIDRASYEADFAGMQFSVEWREKRGNSLAQEADRWLDFSRKRGYRVEPRESLTLSGHPGVALRAALGKGGFGWSARLYETGDRIYSVVVSGASDGLNGPLAQKFFQSFRITE